MACANEQAARDYLDGYVREHGDAAGGYFGLESNTLAPGAGGLQVPLHRRRRLPDDETPIDRGEVGRLAEMVDGLLLSLDYWESAVAD